MTPCLGQRRRRYDRRTWSPIRILAENAGVYVIANAATYGIFLIRFGLGLAFPHLSQAQHARLEGDGTGDLVRSLIANPWLFALTILAVNTFKMGLLTIVAPSLIVPFSGIVLFAYWDLTTGMTLVPASDIGWVALIPHPLTLIVELQAYLLLLSGVFLLGNWYVVRPGTVGVERRREGYLRGLRDLVPAGAAGT